MRMNERLRNLWLRIEPICRKFQENEGYFTNSIISRETGRNRREIKYLLQVCEDERIITKIRFFNGKQKKGRPENKYIITKDEYSPKITKIDEFAYQFKPMARKSDLSGTWEVLDDFMKIGVINVFKIRNIYFGSFIITSNLSNTLFRKILVEFRFKVLKLKSDSKIDLVLEVFMEGSSIYYSYNQDKWLFSWISFSNDPDGLLDVICNNNFFSRWLASKKLEDFNQLSLNMLREQIDQVDGISKLFFQKCYRSILLKDESPQIKSLLEEIDPLIVESIVEKLKNKGKIIFHDLLEQFCNKDDEYRWIYGNLVAQISPICIIEFMEKNGEINKEMSQDFANLLCMNYDLDFLEHAHDPYVYDDTMFKRILLLIKGKLGTLKETSELLDILGQDKHLDNNILEVIGEIGGEKDSSSIIELFKSNNTHFDVITLIVSLAKLNSPYSIATSAFWLENGCEVEKEYVKELLWLISDKLLSLMLSIYPQANTEVQRVIVRHLQRYNYSLANHLIHKESKNQESDNTVFSTLTDLSFNSQSINLLFEALFLCEKDELFERQMLQYDKEIMKNLLQSLEKTQKQSKKLKIIDSLGVYGNINAINVLIEHISTKDEVITQACQIALNKIMYYEFTIFKDALNHDYPEVRDLVHFLLGKKREETTKILLEYLPSQNKLKTQIILEMLGKTGGKIALSAIKPYLMDKDIEIRLTALKSARLINDPCIAKELISLLSDECEEIRVLSFIYLYNYAINDTQDIVEEVKKSSVSSEEKIDTFIPLFPKLNQSISFFDKRFSKREKKQNLFYISYDSDTIKLDVDPFTRKTFYKREFRILPNFMINRYNANLAVKEENLLIDTATGDLDYKSLREKLARIRLPDGRSLALVLDDSLRNMIDNDWGDQKGHYYDNEELNMWKEGFRVTFCLERNEITQEDIDYYGKHFLFKEFIDFNEFGEKEIYYKYYRKMESSEQKKFLWELIEKYFFQSCESNGGRIFSRQITKSYDYYMKGTQSNVSIIDVKGFLPVQLQFLDLLHEETDKFNSLLHKLVRKHRISLIDTELKPLVLEFGRINLNKQRSIISTISFPLDKYEALSEI